MKIQFLQIIKKLKEDPLETQKSKKERYMRILKQSHSAEILKRGDLFGTAVCCKISKNLKGDPLKAKKNRKKVALCRKKIRRGDPSISSAFANVRKSFWLKQGLEPVIAGFPVNRLKSVLKSGTYTMRSVVWRKKLATVIVGLFSLEKHRIKTDTYFSVKEEARANWLATTSGVIWAELSLKRHK